MKHIHRSAALLLALCLLAGLTACGKRPPEKTAQTEALGGAAYMAQIEPCELPVSEVTALCAAGDFLYIAGLVSEETGEGELSYGFSTSVSVSGTDGEEEGSTVFSGVMGRPALFRMDPATGKAEELTGYAPVPVEGGDTAVTALVPGGDGTLWALEEATASLDFSGGGFTFAGENLSSLGTPVSRLWRKLDTAGAELRSLDVTGLADQLGTEEVTGMTMDSQDRLWASTGAGVAVLDAEGRTLFTLQDPNLDGTLVRLEGGVGALTADGGALRAADPEAQSWSGDHALIGAVRRLYDGSGDYAFCYDSGDSLYAFPKDGGAGERLFSWSGAGVDCGEVAGFTFLPDGRGAALLAKRDSWPAAYELALLSPSEGGDRAERTVLTFAALSLDSEIRTRILDFNRSSTQYRIEIRDYSELNTSDDPTAGLTRLNTEIAAGSVPDILDASGAIPIRQYGARGVLEDLWPYIESDPDLGREGVMERVLQAAGTGGALYRVFSSFTIQSAAGDPAIVGDRTSWTQADLQAALKELQEGASVLRPDENRASILRTLLYQNLDQYLDWSAGTARFDTPAFQNLLTFCASFPPEVERDPFAIGSTANIYAAVSAGEQLLLPADLSGFDGVQIYRELFGGEAAFVGYPRDEGCGSSFSIGRSMAMSSACRDKEGAWSFLRTLLLPVDEDFYGAFPINRESFERMREESMEAEYVLDENGEIYLDEKGQPVIQGMGTVFINNRAIEMHPATQAECDQVMALYESIDTVTGTDEHVWSIVQECTAAYFAGDKSAEETAKAIQSRVVLYMNEQL